jgi:hypothetical protein
MDPDIVLAWDWLNDQLRHILNPLYYTPMGAFIRNVPWMHPTFEILQVLGVSLLLGAVTVLDLRLIGWPRRVPHGSLHGMITVARGAAVLTLVSGVVLVCGSPDRYLFNAEARWKVIFLLIAASNILLFDTRAFRQRDATAAHESPLIFRVLAFLGLIACLGAIALGRLAATGGT